MGRSCGLSVDIIRPICYNTDKVRGKADGGLATSSKGGGHAMPLTLTVTFHIHGYTVTIQVKVK